MSARGAGPCGSSFGYASREEDLLLLLRQRDGELEAIKEERRDKEAAINFLKMKIATLQNQSRVEASVRDMVGDAVSGSGAGAGTQGAAPTSIVERGNSAEAAALMAAIDSPRRGAGAPLCSPASTGGTGASTGGTGAACGGERERDSRVEELERQLTRTQHELQQCRRSAVQRMSSASLTWELEELKRQLADKEQEVERLQRSLEWQEREARNICERSAHDLEELRDHFFARDQEVEELRRALEANERASGREKQLEEELGRQKELNQRSTELLDRAAAEVHELRRQLAAGQDRSDAEAEELQQQLAAAKREISQLHHDLQSARAERNTREPAVAIGGSPRDAMSDAAVAAGAAARAAAGAAARAAGAAARLGAAAAGGGAMMGSEAFSARCQSGLGDNDDQAAAAQRAAEAAALFGHQALNTVQDHGAYGGTFGSPRETAKTRLDQETSRPGPEMILSEESSSEEGTSDTKQVPSHITLASATAAVEQTAAGENYALAPSVPQEADASPVGEAEPHRTNSITTEADASPASPTGAEPVSSSSAPNGDARLFSINFFDENEEDIAAKEQKRQQLARQMERRRQARAAASAAAAAASATPSSSAATAVRSVGAAPTSEASVVPVTPFNFTCTTAAAEGPTSSAATPRGRGGADVSYQLGCDVPRSARSGSPPLTSRTDVSASVASHVSIQVPASARALSPAGLVSSGGAPTLHSKFAGLRDEMKRRRSNQTLEGSRRSVDPVEVAEAVLAEANAVTHTRAVSSTSTPMDTPTHAMVASAVAAATAALGDFAMGAELAPSPEAPPLDARKAQPPTLLLSPCSMGVPSPMNSPGRQSRELLNSSGASDGRVSLAAVANQAAVSAAGGTGPSSRSAPGRSAASNSNSAGGGTSAPNFYVSLAPASGSSQQTATSLSSPRARAAPSQQQPISPGSVVSPRPGTVSSNVSSSTSGVHPQRIRSMPVEPAMMASLSARSGTGSGEMDRSRRAIFPLSARNMDMHNSAMAAGGGSGTRSPPVATGGYGAASQHTVQRPRPGDAPGGVEVEGHDTLHDAVTRFSAQRPAGRFQLVRLSRGVYLYGTKKLVVAIHNDKLMARIGGGFVALESYLVDADRAACAPTVTGQRRRS